MTTLPPPRTPAQRGGSPPSPKEDGEIGETISDLLARHPNLSPGMDKALNAVNEHQDVLSPQVAAAVGRLLSAALSPLRAVKASPQAAREALGSIATEMLPMRKAKAKQVEQRHAQVLAQLAREAAAEVEKERNRGARVAQQKADIFARRPRDKITKEKSGRVLRERT